MLKVLFLGGVRYSQPLEATQAKKFKALAALGSIYAIGFSARGRPLRFDQEAHFYLLPLLPLPVLRYALVFGVGTLVALWIMLRHDVRLVVAQGPYEGAAAATAKRLARVLGKRVALIVESHGDFEKSLFEERRVRARGLYRIVMRTCARYALARADALRAVSGATTRQLLSWAPGRPIVQFPTWTDMETFLASGAAEGRGEEKAILYAGVLTPLKGVHFLLAAFARIAGESPEARLWVVGKAQNREYAEELRAEVERLGLGDRVLFQDAVPQRQLARMMSQAAVLVLPSVSEGLPRVLFEAMACGTPVIGSSVGGIPELIAPGENGFLAPPGDVEQLSDRLRWVLRNPAEAREMGRRARAFAEAFFSEEAYVRGYAGVFRAAREAVC